MNKRTFIKLFAAALASAPVVRLLAWADRRNSETGPAISSTALTGFRLPLRSRRCRTLRISVVQVGPRQKVRTDHFQTVASGSVTSQHQGCRFDRSFNNWRLALVQFEVDNLPRFGFPPRQFPLNLLLELLLGHLPCPVQPGCTAKRADFVCHPPILRRVRFALKIV